MHEGLRLIHNNISGIDFPIVTHGRKLGRKLDFCNGCTDIDENCHGNICMRDGNNIKKLSYKKGNIVVDKWEAEGIVDTQRITESQHGKVIVSDCVLEDWCIFASFKNPYDDENLYTKKNRVVLINGLHTFGGVGAFRTLSNCLNFIFQFY